MSVRSSVVESIRANYPSLFPGWKGRDVEIERIQGQRKLGLNVTYSMRFLCTVRAIGTAADTKTVFVKCKGNVAQEYDNLRLLWTNHYCRTSEYLIPRPIFLDKRNNLLFLERVNGGSFLKRFYANWRSKQTRLRLLKTRVVAVAKWLVDFQNIHRSNETRETGGEILNWENHVANLQGATTSEKKRIVAKMAGLIDHFPPYRETFVTRQLLPRNIMIVGDDKVCVVDFPRLTKGWPFYDFLTFILGIEKLELYPLISREDCQHLRDIFAAEYFAQNNLKYDSELVENLWAAHVITDVRRRYQGYKGVRVKGLGNNYFVYNTVRRLADWSKK